MKISYDPTQDTLSLVFAETSISSHELGEGFVVEYDAEGQLTRVQIPHAMNTASGKDVFRQLVVEGIGPFGKNDPLLILPRLFENAGSSE